jgi:3-hydroxy-D-aspartate aldolase
LSLVGLSVDEVPTPALLIDLDNFEWNIEKMFNFARKVGVGVRPHSKTFKAAAICNRLIAEGAVGVMTQKLSEAEALLHSGILYGEKNILMSQELTDPGKVERLVGLGVAMGEGKVLTSVDDVREVDMLNEAAMRWGIKQHVVIEVSHGRCGTAPGKLSVDLAEHIHRLPGLVFRGIYGYENTVKSEVALERDKLTVDTAEGIRAAGIPVEIVSAGSTDTYEVTGSYPGITEIEPGSFVFGVGPEGSGYGWGSNNDVYFKSSLTVLTTVIGANFQDRVELDAGTKALSGGNPRAVPPVLASLGGEKIHFDRAALSEEHCTLSFKDGDPERARLRWGDRVELTPSHCCTCVNQHDEMLVVKGGRVAAVWPITARGKYT